MVTFKRQSPGTYKSICGRWAIDDGYYGLRGGWVVLLDGKARMICETYKAAKAYAVNYGMCRD